MKKFLVFLALLISFAIVQSASAYPVQVGDYINLDSYNTTTRAGEFNFKVKDSDHNPTGTTISTFCLERDATTYLNRDYEITGLEEGSGDATAGSDAWDQVAWLYWKYDQGTLDTAGGDDGEWSGLQYAYWSLVDNNYQLPDNNYGASSYLDLAAEAVDCVNGWTNNGRVKVAVNLGQNILVASPVPEPATMLLLGTGLIGIAGIRRKFKK